ncbi:zinc finger protein 638 isoform X2 [Rhinoderma darwinii]|uniref:zinc finger protein 638 isoform X2 n=1 Tax=Rhinoderma darwinii TaxID=43563 RepID=UPI003F6618CC
MFNRGGFPGQRPMGHGLMNQQGMNMPSMNMPGMNLPSMNLPSMNLPSMNLPSMNLPSINMPGMNMPAMNMPGMNMSGMNMSPMNQPNMNLSGMNLPGINQQHMGHPGMGAQNIGHSGMNQPNMNRMNPPNMNQGGGMDFRPEMKSQGFGMRPMDSPGSFVGGNTDPIGIKSMPIRAPMHMSSDRLMGQQGLPQRFSSPSLPMHQQGQPRMPSQSQEIPSIVNRVLTHSSDRMIGNIKVPLQEPAHLMKEKQWSNLTGFGNAGQDMGMKSIPSGTSLDRLSNPQNRYTNESASSILESFGLSNEDLEELSRYPDDQLTPSNMPSILRDIRLRKMNRTPSAPDQAPGRRPANEAAQNKVIDYGHSSKYQYNNPATPAQSADPPRTEQKPPQIPKATPAPSNTKPKMTPEKGMDNKIPTISKNRKPVWPTSKLNISNNKTLVDESANAPAAVSVTVSNVEKPVVSLQAVAAAIPEIAAPAQTDLKPAAQVVTGVQPPTETPDTGKGSSVPVLSPEETQKKKKLPTPSMMNDYYAATPRIFPHICSLCNIECRHLETWIKHQNYVSHTENCRSLRQKYPDWNPHLHPSVRKESKKDESTSKKSKSKSVSPRRSRRSGSRHRARKSRSRSPRSSGRRSRSRSPRKSRRSPRRSHSPRRGARSPHRSRSPKKYKRSSRSNSPDKKAVDAAVQNFIECTKTKSVEKAKPSSNGKKVPAKPSNTNKKPASSASSPKKPSTSAPKPSSTSSSSSSSKKPSNSNSDKKPNSSNTEQKPASTSSVTKKPTSGSSNYKKPVVSTGAKKTTVSAAASAKKPQPSKQPASNRKAPGSPKATSNPLNKFTGVNSGKVVHVTNLPDSGYTDQDILKIVQPFGKVSDIFIVRSKNEAFLETNFREAALAAVKFSETTPVMINNQRVTVSLAGQSKAPTKSAEKGEKVKEAPTKAAAPSAKSDPKAPVKGKDAPEKEAADKKLQEKSKHDIDVPDGFVKFYKLDDPPLKDNDKCVILISNLPEGKYTVDEITNLAKPFGGVNDVLIVANHKKAYMELTSRSSVDSMIKFYNVFPTYLSGNLLTICIAQRYKDLKDEDRIFADLIEQSPYKITPSIYEKFVYLTNLPEKDLEDFEIIRVGLRFGKVEHHVFLSNKKKAILHLHNANSAKAMHSFLSQYPCSIGDNVIQCSLPSKTKLAEDEYLTFIELETQSTESDVEKTESKPAAAESTKPNQEKEKRSKPIDKKPKPQPSPAVSQPVIVVDTAESKEAPAPPSDKIAVVPDTIPAKPPAKPHAQSSAKPPAQSSAKPPAQSSAKPHAQSSAKPPAQSSAKPPAQSSAKPPAQSSAKPPAQSSAKPPAQSSAKPPAQSSAKPPAQSSAKPPAQSSAKPPAQSSAKPPAQSSAKPPAQSSAKPPAQSSAKPPAQSSAKPPAQSSAKPPAQSSAKPPAQSSAKPPAQSSAKPPAQSSAKPPAQSTAKPPAQPPSSEPPPSTYMVATEDDDYEEEAAEAPEAPDMSPLYVQPEPETQCHEPHPVCRLQVSDELEVLVSVESDEEEIEEQQQVFMATKQGPQAPLVVTETDELLDTEMPADEGGSDSPDSDGKETDEDAQNECSEPSQPPKPGSVGNKNRDIERRSPDKVQDPSANFSNVKVTKDSRFGLAGKADIPPAKSEESEEIKTETIGADNEGLKSVEEKPGEQVLKTEVTSQPSEEIPGHPLPAKDELEVPEKDKTAATSSAAMVRTTKYNPQKGELSVTVTLDSQKANAKAMESRKRPTRERGSSGHESGTPRPSSNRSSPSDSASSHTKSGSSFSQKKAAGKHVSSQPERDSKDIPKLREKDARSSSKKDDRTKGSSSSRYARNSKSNNRSPRSKEEEEEENFPFNMDEFVTVDEIVEERGDSKKRAGEQRREPEAARKGKRKENDPVPSDTKKSRVMSTDSHKPSFVTLDEVGDEEENNCTPENVADQTAQSMVTLDEVHAEVGPHADAKEAQMLMTLDEISDEDDAHDSATGQRSSKIPEILNKDRLVTLDEVNEEDEEQAATEPSNVDRKLPEAAKNTEEDGDKELETEDEILQDVPVNADQGDITEPPLLTLDEVKADDDDMSFADIEHQFLTVDEVGEEEEESEVKAEENEKSKPGVESKPSETNSSSKVCEPTPPSKRGRPRKRPLPQSAQGNTDSSQQTPPDASKGAATKKTPTRSQAKLCKDRDQATPDHVEDSALPDKPESADGKPETPAKKTKVESPPAEMTKLAPFNSSPVGLEFLVPKTGYFCELCSLFYMDDSSKLKHCRTLKHYQAVEKRLAKLDSSPELKSSST